MVIKLKLFNRHKKKTEERQDNHLLKIKQPEELLKKHCVIIDSIFHHSHTTRRHWKKLYLPCLHRLASWSQELPASQSHHHHQNGGFLTHTLEVIDKALEKRQTKMLPIGVNVEAQNDKKDVWTYAVFVCALMHDIGKTISDIHIVLYDTYGKELGRWSSWLGPLSNTPATHYRYLYNKDRKYQLHSLLPLTEINYFIGYLGMDWLQQEKSLFTLVLLTLQGRYTEGGVIADIIKHADSQSSAQSLSKSLSTNNEITPKSLADKLLDTLKYLVLETDIKINEPGAIAYTTATDIYFVSKVILDSVRNALIADKQSGIPFDNTRLMDELLQFHIIIPCKENDKEKAIWQTTLSGGGFKKPVQLTMLRMDITKIYTDNIPSAFEGSIVLDDVNNDSQEKIEPSIKESNTEEIEIEKQMPVTDDIQNKKGSLPLPPGLDLELAVATDDDIIESPSKEPHQETTTVPTGDIDSENKNLGSDFLKWLQQSIIHKRIEVNTPTAKLHVVLYKDKPALFLVSPKIFKEYNIDHWSKTQKQFTRLKINKKNSKNENIWQVLTITKRKDKKPSKIKGYLITDLSQYQASDIRKPNNFLTLIQDI